MPASTTLARVKSGIWTIVFMSMGALSSLLILLEKGFLWFLGVAFCTVVFFFRRAILRKVEDTLEPTDSSGIVAPVLLSFCVFSLASGLVLGFFVNGSNRPPGTDGGGWLGLAGFIFILAVTIQFFRWTQYTLAVKKMHYLGGKEKEKFANATGWADPAQVFTRFGLPPSGNSSEPVIGIHIGNGLHWNELGHILTLGGSGQGKGTCLVLPALLSDGLVRAGISVVCLDPKGENAAVSAPHLRRVGYDVHVINPFGIQEIAHLGNSRWNPFDLVEDGDEKKFCDVLAYSLHNRRSGGDGEFFNSRCRQYISLYARYVLHEKRQGKTPGFATMFQRLYYFLKLAGPMREDLLAKMAEDHTFSGWMDAEAILSRVTTSSIRTEDNIFSTIESAIDILGDQKLQESLAASDFDLRQIAQKPTAIFICVRHDELEYYATWLRMFTDALLKTLNRYYNPSRKVMVLLDEFAQMGYIDQYAKAPAILRGYNVTLWPIIQNLGQLYDIYGRDVSESFFGNSVVKHYFGGFGGTVDNTTAEYISKRMPKEVHLMYDDNGKPHGREQSVMDISGFMGYDKIICEVVKIPKPFEVMKTPYWQLKFAMNNYSNNPFQKQ